MTSSVRFLPEWLRESSDGTPKRETKGKSGPLNSRQFVYRPDIDGLRAIAVLSVVLYHFGFGIGGGFVGVDIFFVISGFLITGIIHSEIARGEFTFSGFYERRVRRIFPALFVVVLMVVVVAPFVLLPSDMVRLGKGVLATVFFCSNVLFWRQSGYFDVSSEYNPLLHTWSLGVEEQFYICFPIFLILVQRYAASFARIVILLVAILSLALCLWQQPVRPMATFYLFPFRAWELLLGALLALKSVPEVQNHLLRGFMAMVGATVLFAAVVLVKAGVDFPGWQAIIPVVATGLVIHAGTSGDTLVGRLLSLPPMVAIGKISYSIYLWHWPLLVYWRYVGGTKDVATLSGIGLLLATLALSWASYVWVERPLRGRKSRRRTWLQPLFGRAFFVMCLLAGLAVLSMQREGWANRFSPVVVKFDRQRDPVIPFENCDGRDLTDASSGSCVVGSAAGGRRILLWGDSHALAWAPGIAALSARIGAQVYFAVDSACPPLLDTDNPVDPMCRAANDRRLAWIVRNRPDEVIMVASWTSYSVPNGFYTIRDDQGEGNGEVFPRALARTIKELSLHVERILLVGPTPGAPGNVPFEVAYAQAFGKAWPKPTTLRIFGQQAKWFWNSARSLQGGYRKLVLIDPAPWFCDDRSCRYATGSGALLYRDAGHLSVAGAMFAAGHLGGLLDRRGPN